MNRIVYILVAYFFISFITGIEWVWQIDSRIYFVGQQICNLLLLFIISKSENRYIKITATSLIILTLFELFDELFNLNDRFRINDYVVSVLVILSTIYRLVKHVRKTRTHCPDN